MSLNQRQWDILCKLQGSDSPLTTTKLAKLVARTNMKANDVSFREIIARDLRDLTRITGAIESKKILSENEEGHGYRENAYSWKAGGPAYMANTLTTAQSVALGVLQKVGLGLVPQALADELKPLFIAIHRNELVKHQSDKDLGKHIPKKKAVAAEQKWLSKVAIRPETVMFLPHPTSAEVEKMVHEALYQEKLIEIHYLGKARLVKPLALVQRGVRRYLIGICRGEEAPRRFTMSRITKAKEVHALSFDDIPGGEGFDLDDFLRKGLAYPVFNEEDLGTQIVLKLWVNEGTYRWISETPLDESQIAEKVDDGYVLIVSTYLTEELVFWILSMAHHVRVLEPNILKDRVASDLRKAARLYEAN